MAIRLGEISRRKNMVSDLDFYTDSQGLKLNGTNERMYKQLDDDVVS